MSVSAIYFRLIYVYSSRASQDSPSRPFVWVLSCSAYSFSEGHLLFKDTRMKDEGCARHFALRNREGIRGPNQVDVDVVNPFDGWAIENQSPLVSSAMPQSRSGCGERLPSVRLVPVRMRRILSLSESALVTACAHSGFATSISCTAAPAREILVANPSHVAAIGVWVPPVPMRVCMCVNM